MSNKSLGTSLYAGIIYTVLERERGGFFVAVTPEARAKMKNPELLDNITEDVAKDFDQVEELIDKALSGE